MRTLKFIIQLTIIVFSLPSIIIMLTANEPWKTKTNEMDQNLPITTDRRDLLTRLEWTKMIDGIKKHKPLVEDLISELAYHWKLQLL